VELLEEARTVALPRRVLQYMTAKLDWQYRMSVRVGGREEKVNGEGERGCGGGLGVSLE